MRGIVAACILVAACGNSAPDPLDAEIAKSVKPDTALEQRVRKLEARVKVLETVAAARAERTQGPSQARADLVEHARRKELEGRIELLERRPR